MSLSPEAREGAARAPGKPIGGGWKQATNHSVCRSAAAAQSKETHFLSRPLGGAEERAGRRGRLHIPAGTRESGSPVIGSLGAEGGACSQSLCPAPAAAPPTAACAPPAPPGLARSPAPPGSPCPQVPRARLRRLLARLQRLQRQEGPGGAG